MGRDSAPPKAKPQKMSLADFLTDGSTGSWADEVATLPTAPASRSDADDDRRNSRFGSRNYGERQGGYDRESRGDRFDSRDSQRETRALPTQPPFTAHVGNLSFDVVENDLAEFFGELKISNIRILKDRDEKSKGFGYIEFEDLDSLKGALELNSESLKSRTVRVSIAEPQSREREVREVREDRTAGGSWRRETPLPPSGGDGPRDRFNGRNERGGFTDRTERGGFRDRFSDRSERLDRSGPGDRQRDTTWPGGAFTNKSNRDDRPLRNGGNGGNGGFNEPADWRESKPRNVPAERPRLALQPRTSTAPITSPSQDTTPKGPKTDPFGAAKPVDAEEAWRRTEERRKQREAAKKVEEQQKDEEDLTNTQSQNKSE